MLPNVNNTHLCVDSFLSDQFELVVLFIEQEQADMFAVEEILRFEVDLSNHGGDIQIFDQVPSHRQKELEIARLFQCMIQSMFCSGVESSIRYGNGSLGRETTQHSLIVLVEESILLVDHFETADRAIVVIHDRNTQNRLGLNSESRLMFMSGVVIESRKVLRTLHSFR